MSTDPALNLLNPDQLLARLIEMEGVIEQQKVALNAFDDERNDLKSERDHFKGAFEEADAERQRLELVIRQLLRAQFGRKSERLDPAQFQAHPGKPRAGHRGGQGPSAGRCGQRREPAPPVGSGPAQPRPPAGPSRAR